VLCLEEPASLVERDGDLGVRRRHEAVGGEHVHHRHLHLEERQAARDAVPGPGAERHVVDRVPPALLLWAEPVTTMAGDNGDKWGGNNGDDGMETMGTNGVETMGTMGWNTVATMGGDNVDDGNNGNDGMETV
jgi:hypothetical protein